MEPLTDKHQKSDEEILSHENAPDQPAGDHTEKTGTAHLTGRISELSVFGLLWG